jgi:hypothetical protein
MAAATRPLSDNFFQVLRFVKLHGLYTQASRRFLIQAFTWFCQQGEAAPCGTIGRYLVEQGCSEALAAAERCWQIVAEVCAYQAGQVPTLFDPSKHT